MTDKKSLSQPEQKTIVGDFLMSDLRRSEQTESGIYVTLTVIEGQDFGYIFNVDKTENVIGRKGEGADLPLNDQKVSARHLLITKQQKDNEKVARVVALDLGSTNGCFLNGQRLSQDNEAQLRNGDKIQIGDTVLKLEIKDFLDASYHERLYQQATKDILTGLWNRAYARQELDKLTFIAKSKYQKLSLFLINIDLLNVVNRSYGHKVGDAALSTLAKIVTRNVREQDLVARYSSEEIIVILPEMGIEEAVKRAENIRQAMEKYDFSSEGCSQSITVCVGVAQFGGTSEEFVKEADDALQKAKRTGRNRVCSATFVEKKNTLFASVLRVLGTVVLLLALIALGVFLYPMLNNKKDDSLSLSGTVETNKIQIGSKIGGRIKEVLVEEGQTIKIGQTIATFDTADLLKEKETLHAKILQEEANLIKLKNGNRKEEIEEAEAILGKEKAILEALNNGPRPQEIEQVKAELSEAESNFATAEINFQRVNKVYSRGFAPKQQLDEAENLVKTSKAKVELVQAKLSLLEAGTRSEEIKAAQARCYQAEANARLMKAGTRSEEILRAEAQLQEAKANLAKLDVTISEGEIKSPCDALVESIRVRPGDIIAPNKAVALLLEKDQIWLRVYVPETELGKIKLDQKVDIKIDSFPDKTFPGYIKQISSEAEFIPRNVQTRNERENQVFGVKIYFDNKDGIFKSGMTAEAKMLK